ncbi:hypothetical protein AVEN_17284-1 [Araneus ventricosus]|uniref:Uncharacterized protein n=2 Tax=Araneus ventricosus TaxID=182803 RepID=A0A4Y2E4P9_ARAVE|nr:hypothetical protein AVEN_17284-1 [Araneus ventricosus]
MAYLFAKGVKKCDLFRLAYELYLPIIPNMTLLELMKLILRSDNYDEEETRNILDSVRGEREDAEKWERLGGRPATSIKELFYCGTKGYQTDTDNDLAPSLLIELGLEKNSVKLTANEIMSLVYASEAFDCKTDAKSEIIQNLNRKVVGIRIPELCSEVNNDLISENNLVSTQAEKLHELVVKEISETPNVENIPLKINDDCKNDFYQKRNSRSETISEMIGVDKQIDEIDRTKNLRNLANATIDTSHEIDYSEDKLSVQEELDVSKGSENSDEHELSSTNDKICCRNHKMHESELKGICLASEVIRGKHHPLVFRIYLPFDTRERPPCYLIFEVNMRLLFEHWLDPGEENNAINLNEI